MRQSRVNFGNASYKDWIGLSAAPVFWLASLVCFALGLAFKTSSGIFIPGTTLDVTFLFSIGLGFANTAIQIVGNDTEKEDLGIALLLMWGASYMLGIGSNVNFLYSIIGLSNGLLQFLVCWGLGIMIEVAPERLLVRWLRAVGILGTGTIQTHQPQRQSQNQQLPREQRHEQMRRDSQSRSPSIQNTGQQSVRNRMSPNPQNPRVAYRPDPDPDDIPEFLRHGMG